MTVPNLLDAVQITTEAEFDASEDVQNVWTLGCTASTMATQADWETDLNTLMNTIIAIIKGYASALTIWRSYKARNITQGTPTEHFFMSPTVAGTLTGDNLASGTAAMMVWRTDIPKITLRKYLGPPTESVNDSEGQWSSSFITGAVADLISLSAPLVAAKSTWVYTHWDVDTASFANITGGYFGAEPAYQRRRRRGRGS